MKNLNLHKFWKKYVDRDIYRIISEEYVPSIKSKGLNPANDPFQKKFKDINSLFNLMIKIEKNLLLKSAKPISGWRS